MKIRFGPGAAKSEEDLAGTIALEPQRAWACLGSDSNSEGADLESEHALGQYIHEVR